MTRYEYKYLITPERLAEIRRFLLRYCVPDSHGGNEWYRISSLYLDTAGYRLFRDAEEQVAWRLKLRVRGYGKGAGPVKLEVKRRAKELIIKNSGLVSPDGWERIARAGLSEVSCAGEDAIDEFVRLTESLRAAPKMLVEYERLAFSSTVDNYVRVTFDRRMKCQAVRRWTLSGDPGMWRAVDDPASLGNRESAYVMEVKFAAAPPAWIRDLTATFGLVQRGYSKYGRGVRRSKCAESAWDLRPVPPPLSAAWRFA